MAGLTAEFSRDDVETLIEAIGDWEMIGNQDYHILSVVKNTPMPPEEYEEAYEAIGQIKEHFKKREKEIMKSREVRQEKSIFLKAKLMLVRKEIGINQLFDMASAIDPTAPPPKKEESVSEETPRRSKVREDVAALKERLEMAEYFIKDVGIQAHYEKFLTEKAEEKKAKEAEAKAEENAE